MKNGAFMPLVLKVSERQTSLMQHVESLYY